METEETSLPSLAEKRQIVYFWNHWGNTTEAVGVIRSVHGSEVLTVSDFLLIQAEMYFVPHVSMIVLQFIARH